MVNQSGSPNWICREAGLILVSLLVLFPFTNSARASNLDESPLDAAALLQLEQRADAAQPRDQCYMFAEVLHGLTEPAGREIAAGDEQEAEPTLTHIDSVAAKMQRVSAANAKRLKNAEMLLEHVTRRLNDMAHVISTSQRNAMQTTMQCVDHLLTQVLAVIFS